MATRALPSGGGYDYQFVKTPSDMLICTVCFLPSKQPYLSECCGHTFCKSCLEGSKKFSNICPICRSENFKAMFNKQADRVIRSLHVFCINKEQGCKWQGEVNNITNHHGNCLFRIVYCPNDCGKFLQQQYLIIHVENECPRRRVHCQYCNDVGEYQFIGGQHKEECLKFPIQCPNKCEIKSIYRDEIEEHREICPLEIVQCDYHVVGCKVKTTRKDMKVHKQEMMEVHLSLSINELIETKTQLKNKVKHEVENTKREIVKTLKQQLVQTEKNLTAKLTASQQEAKRTKDQLLQKLGATKKELNTTKQQLATTCQNLTKEHTTLAASTDKALAEMESRFQAKITAAENRIAGLENKLQQKTQLIEGIFGPWLTSLLYRASKLSSGDQVVPVVVKMTEFTKHVRSKWLSKPFYNNCNKECELQLEVATEFYMHNYYVSLTLIVDYKESKQSTDRFIVHLLNQISDSEHHVGKNYQYFISHQCLYKKTDTCQYLKDDTLFFEVLKSKLTTI